MAAILDGLAPKLSRRRLKSSQVAGPHVEFARAYPVHLVHLAEETAGPLFLRALALVVHDAAPLRAEDRQGAAVWRL